MSEKEIEPYYRRQAKDITNTLFDKGFLADDLARESIDGLEDYLAFLIQSQCQMSVAASGFSKKVRDMGARTQADA